jgi:spermidine synthase
MIVDERTAVRAGIFWSGALQSGVQILIIRRAMALCGGDEVVFALTLALWLLAVAFGSWIASLCLRSRVNAKSLFVIGLMLLSCAVPASLWLLLQSALLTGWIPGTSPGGGGLFPALAGAVFPPGFIGGFLFPTACRMLQPADKAVNSAFYLEAAGAFTAGICLTLLFFPRLDPLTPAGILAVIGFISAAAMMSGRGIKRPLPMRWFPPAAAILLFIAAFGILKKMDVSLVARLRPGQELILSRQTPYGLLEATRRQGQIAVYENGLTLAISDDIPNLEEQGYLLSAQHPDPHRVLWIGGFIGGSLQAALRTPSIEKFDLVELNPALFEIGRALFPADSAVWQDPRLTLYAVDGRRFLAQSPKNSYDLIALNLPGPRTARLSKFYTQEGFRLAQRALRPGGVLVFGVESSEDFIGADLAEYLASLRTTLQSVFPRVVVLSGNRAVFIAGDSTSHPATTAAEITTRLEQRGIMPLYWDAFRLADRLSASHQTMLEQALASHRDLRINRDRFPISFYLQQIFASRQLRGGYPEFLKVARKWAVWAVPGLPLIILLWGFALRIRKPGRRFLWGVNLAVLGVGMTSISLEILALSEYQISFGSGYREVGLLTGFYMAGLALGGYVSAKMRANNRRFFPWIQSVWFALPLLLFILTVVGVDAAPMWLGEGLFVFFLSGCGFAGGLHFPVAVGIFAEESEIRAGRLYALDLAGAAFGAIFFGFLALPLVGAVSCLAGMALLNLSPLVLLTGRNRASAI